MKKILFLLLILIGNNSFSQDTIWNPRFEMDSMGITRINKSFWYVRFYPKDTVKVVLLMCDTARPYHINEYYTFDTIINGFGHGHSIRDTVWLDYRPVVFWKWGYEVLEKHNTSEGQIDPGICPECWQDYWKHVKYLGLDKKPLDKKYIIWESIKSKSN